MLTQCGNDECGEQFEVENDKFGQMVECKKCGKEFRALFCIDAVKNKDSRKPPGKKIVKKKSA